MNRTRTWARIKSRAKVRNSRLSWNPRPPLGRLNHDFNAVGAGFGYINTRNIIPGPTIKVCREREGLDTITAQEIKDNELRVERISSIQSNPSNCIVGIEQVCR